MYQVNYLAHFLIIQLLMPQLLASAKARQGPGGVTRIVSQSSDVSFRGVCDLDNLNGEKSFGTAQFYANSKLMQVMMTTELAERLGAPEKSGIAVHAVHPGVVASGLNREVQKSVYLKRD
jgi:NAD(P)-dependent dehydrogenase (short-subunit alcohol dehydrogenase family)